MVISSQLKLIARPWLRKMWDTELETDTSVIFVLEWCCRYFEPIAILEKHKGEVYHKELNSNKVLMCADSVLFSHLMMAIITMEY